MVELAFILLTVVAVATAILSLEAREIVYGAVSLATMLLAIAGFFILLDAPFVAMFQIIVYVGAVAVLILFTVMLVRREKWVEMKDAYMEAGGILAALLLASAALAILFSSSLNLWIPGGGVAPVAEIGRQIFSKYWAAVEALALVLAASLAGAITMAKLDKKEGEG